MRAHYWDDHDRTPPVPSGRLKVFQVVRQSEAQFFWAYCPSPAWGDEVIARPAREDDDRLLDAAISQFRQQPGNSVRPKLVRNIRVVTAQEGNEQRPLRIDGTGRMCEQCRLR